MRLRRSGFSASTGSFGSKSGSDTMRQHLAGMDVEDDAGSGDRLVAVHRPDEFVAEDVLDAHVDRQLHRLEIVRPAEARLVQVAEPAVVDIFLDAGDALIVDVDEADDMRGGGTAGIEAPVLGEEADAGNAEVVNLLALGRRDLALQPHEAGVAGELARASASRRGPAGRW